MQKTCRQCSGNFEISQDDQDFMKRFAFEIAGKHYDIPLPTLCLDCRMQRRQSILNQLNLFKRKCDATGEEIITNFAPESPHKVYSQEYWYGDKYDGLDYGKDFDFSRPFFEQFNELRLAVPVPALFTDYLHDENSSFTNCAGKNKNCYMIFDSDENWNCYYSYGMNGSKDSLDCYRVQKLELCYEVIDSNNCYKCAYTINCSNCSESLFLNNCTGCRNCIYCSNLVNKQYYVFNENVGKERYEEILKGFGSYEFLMDKIPQFEKFKLDFPQKYMRGVQNENVVGNHVVNSKNAYYCFDSMNLWDCRYCFQSFISAKDCMDIQESGGCELNYETSNSAYNIYNSLFCFQCMDNCNNIQYCVHCGVGTSNCFGCVGLKKKKYCIFNKQYTQEEYEKLASKIIDHMIQTGEYGEFFPIKDSSFGYNLTIAQEYFPLTKEEVLKRGWPWYDISPKEYQPATSQLKDNIADEQPEITKELLACEDCGRNYKIIEQELKLNKTLNLPLPRKCFYCRNLDKIKYRTPRQLFDRQCAKCGIDLKTVYSPERPEIVYCEKCYVETVF